MPEDRGRSVRIGFERSARHFHTAASWERTVPDAFYVYFNDDWEAFAVRNALRLKEILG